MERRLAGKRILVVEDEFYIAMDLERELAEAGATVVGPVASVAEALDLITREPRLDAAALDVNLRGEMVYPVADQLTARMVPYVFATGYNEEDIPEGYSAVTRLFKPVAPGAVAGEIARKMGMD